MTWNPRIATLGLLGLASCGGGSSGVSRGQPGGSCDTVSQSDVMPWEGIYQMLSDTKNTTSCSSEGPSILASQTQTFFFLRSTTNILGESLWLLSCTDVADCQSKRTQFDESQASMGIGPPATLLLFVQCKGPNGSLEDTVASTGFSRSDGTCQSPSLSMDTLSHDASGNTRVEVRIQHGDTYEQVNGFCTTDAAYAASSGKPCTEYDVVVGKFVRGL